MLKIKKPLISDYCKPFFLDPDNKNLVSFDSKSYSKAAKQYIEQLELENMELLKALEADIVHNISCKKT